MADLRHEPWFRLDPVLGDDGALRGQRVTVGLGGGRVTNTLDLPPESFAAGPFGRVILVGSDDGSISRVQAFDVANACTWAIAEERAVIRRATVDPAGSGVYETRVDRASRADLGVWLRPLDGSAAARRILPPLPADDRFGRTFSTEFAWDVAGERLAVQSCGEVACRTRLIAPEGGPTVTLDVPDLGGLLGFDGDRVVTYGACRGTPCPILSTDLATGVRTVLEAEGGPAVVLATPDGVRLVHEVRTGAGRGLRSVALDGAAGTDLGPLPDDLGLHPSPVQAGSATRLPSGWVLLAPDGRLPTDDISPRPQLRHIPDGVTVPLDEAAR
jgi:hypothetical protein